MSEGRWYNTENEQFFIVVFEDDTFSVKNEREISRMFDLSDMGEMDEVHGVYIVRDGKFYRVKTENFYRINTDEEMPFRYGASDLVIQRLGRKETVGTITLTDH